MLAFNLTKGQLKYLKSQMRSAEGLRKLVHFKWRKKKFTWDLTRAKFVNDYMGPTTQVRSCDNQQSEKGNGSIIWREQNPNARSSTGFYKGQMWVASGGDSASGQSNTMDRRGYF